MTELRAAPRNPFALLQRTAIFFAAAAAGLVFALRFKHNLSIFYLQRQDMWLLAVAAVLLTCGSANLGHRTAPLAGSRRLLIAIIAATIIFAFVGHRLILLGYDLSRDEQLATFDAAVFSSGKLVSPLPAFWQPYADALNTTFMPEGPFREAWVSSYLPLNAVFRVLFDFVGSAAFTGPFFIGLGAIALCGCVRRIWPDDPELMIVAVLLYAGSGQILFSGMTSYSMPAHLALNLCWLWLFLRRNKWADAGALIVAFLAVGLHQPHPHPLFVAPILLFLLVERDWRRAGFFFLGYSLIGAFWLAWPHWITMQVTGGIAEKIAAVPYDSSHPVLAQHLEARWSNMAANIFRFVAWQHVLLAPLALVGFWRARRNRLVIALAGGIVLTLLVRLVFLPYQGHGFGYRYMHGLIGSFILVAVYGWSSIGTRLPEWRSLFLRTTFAVFLVVIPLQIWMAHSFYRPVAEVSARISSLDADFAVIGMHDVPYSSDLVINGPHLDNRPIRLVREELGLNTRLHICASKPKVVMVRRSLLQQIATLYVESDRPKVRFAISETASALRNAGCRVSFAS